VHQISSYGEGLKETGSSELKCITGSEHETLVCRTQRGAHWHAKESCWRERGAWTSHQCEATTLCRVVRPPRTSRQTICMHIYTGGSVHIRWGMDVALAYTDFSERSERGHLPPLCPPLARRARKPTSSPAPMPVCAHTAMHRGCTGPREHLTRYTHPSDTPPAHYHAHPYLVPLLPTAPADLRLLQQLPANGCNQAGADERGHGTSQVLVVRLGRLGVLAQLAALAHGAPSHWNCGEGRGFAGASGSGLQVLSR